MKILHTSDWHLGRTLHGVNVHGDQRDFHEFLVATVEEHGVDAVVISGDVYDRSVPPVESVELLGATLGRLADLTTVILTPGNHDSAQRLGFASSLLRPGVHILASTNGVDRPVSVHDEHGEVLFFGLPFLDPDVARYQLAGEDDVPLARSHEAVMGEAMDRVRAALERARSSGGGRVRSVVLAHTFVVGGAPSDSERDLSIGGVDSVPASVFDGVNYVALGHLHGCQNMSGLNLAGVTMWYSGSPLAFSFSEKDHRKSVLLVEIDEAGETTVERIPVPRTRRLVELKGSLESILAKAPEHSRDFVHAIVEEEARPPRLQEQLRASFENVLLTEFRSTREETSAAVPAVARSASPATVVRDFFAYLTGAEPTAQQSRVIESVLADAEGSGA